jgi:hypothetical protein
MKKHSRFAMFAPLAVVILAAVLSTACKSVVGTGGDVPPKAVEFIGSAEVRSDTPNMVRLTLEGEEDVVFAFNGFSGLTLKTEAGNLPADVEPTAQNPNGITGITFDAENANTAILVLNGYVTAEDGNLILSYNKDAQEIYKDDIVFNSFELPVVYVEVEEGTAGPVITDPEAEPIVLAAAIYDEAPKKVRVTFDRSVVISGGAGFTVSVNGVYAEVADYKISGVGLTITLVSGLIYGDTAQLSYIKPVSGGVTDTNGKELQNFVKPIDNFVLQDSGPHQSAALAGLEVSLLHINWLQNDDIKSALTVSAVYSDSTVVALESGSYSISPENPTAEPGEILVTVSYAGRTGSIMINVLSPAVEKLPELAAINVTVPRATWHVGETFLPNVTAVYEDSSVGTVKEGYTISPENPTATEQDDRLVTVSYTQGSITKTDSVVINVKSKTSPLPPLVGVTAGVSKATWIQYEPFNINVEAVYSDGTKNDIASGYILSPSAPTAVLRTGLGVNVMYEGVTSNTVVIDVVEPAKEVTLTEITAIPSKYTWTKGEPFSAVVTTRYSDGTSGVITKGYLINPENPTSAINAKLPVTVTYKDKTTSFDIEVTPEPAKPYRLMLSLDKNVYNFNDSYELTVKALYDDGRMPQVVTGWTSDPVNITGTSVGSLWVTVSYSDGGITVTERIHTVVYPIKLGSSTATSTMLNLTPYVDKPVKYSTPDTAKPDDYNDYFSVASIKWYKAENSAEFTDSTFDGGTEYKAQVELTPKTGYTFTETAQNCFIHTFAQTNGVTNAAGSGIVDILFPATSPRVMGSETDSTESLDLTPFIDKPVYGAVPDKVVSTDQNDYYTVTSIIWHEGNEIFEAFTGPTFKPATVYKAEVTLTPKAGYTINGADNVFTHKYKDPNVSPNLIWSAYKKTITIIFPVTETIYDIAGTVKTDTTALAGVKLTLKKGSAVVATATSAADGKYTIAGVLAASGYTITAVKDVYFDVTTPSFSLNANISGKDISMTRNKLPQPNAKDIMVKFGIKTEGYTSATAADVKEAFTALHDYINTSGKFNTSTSKDTSGNVVRLGDYIDLPSMSCGDYANGAFSYSNNPDLGVHGKLLRILVVGINSYNRRSVKPNGHADTPHVVFQFQNLPVSHEMAGEDGDAWPGYKYSSMRKYMKYRFQQALNAAGVPDEMMWAPVREVAYVHNRTDSWIAQLLLPAVNDQRPVVDKVWIPGDYEMRQSTHHSGGWNLTDHNTNQAFYEYYDSTEKRIKYNLWGDANAYWTSTISYPPDPDVNNDYIYYGDWGGTWTWNKHKEWGVAPAFCIK